MSLSIDPMLAPLRCTAGKSWTEWMGSSLLEQLVEIDKRLESGWKGNTIAPLRQKVLAPFSMLSREDTRMVLICKAPYKSIAMATGIPVECGNNMSTYTSKVFKSAILDYWTYVDESNYMELYYRSGILVLNAVPTIDVTSSSKYLLSDSHFPLWTNFMIPFLQRVVEDNCPILCLGLEARMLVRDHPLGGSIKTCAFPVDTKSSDEFNNTLRVMCSSYLFDMQ